MSKILSIVAQASQILLDEANVSYLLKDLLAATYNAELAVGSVRPDSLMRTEDVQLAVGTRQSLPAGAWRLRDAIMNRGTTGSPQDGAPIRIVERGALQALASASTGVDWRTRTGDEVREVMYDEREPTRFDVYPGMSTGDRLVLLQFDGDPTAYPDPVTEDDETTISTRFEPAMIEWVCFKSLERQDDQTVQGNPAEMHYRKFFELLGTTITADVEVAVKERTQLR